ncbi:MAG: ATP-dependent DNA helicase RecG [Actinomycetota bacterium]|nr:ATP-dependent DNA helicase RecG [Actinomycetota bacterium]
MNPAEVKLWLQAQPCDDNLNLPVSKVKLVGPSISAYLAKMGILTIGDLLYHFPHRYIDLSKIKKIKQLKAGESATVLGEVVKVKKWHGRRGIKVINVTITDGSGYIIGTWFNQDFIANRLKAGMQVAFSGRILYKYNQLQIENPLYDVLKEKGEEPIHSGRIVPVHPATQNLSPNIIRRIIKNALNEYGRVSETIPVETIERYNLLPRSIALNEIHFPSSRELLMKARERFIFEELFLMQVGLAVRKKGIEFQTKGISHRRDGELTTKFYKTLPFKLTEDQINAIVEIQNDMEKPRPMNRLLQGEVGSGKTVVAMIALLTAVQSGYQAAMMAPTEVLANQHYLKVKGTMEKLGVNIELLTGNLSQKERESILQRIKAGDVDIVVGTHALIQQTVDFKCLGVVVIDEQHRFGVEQRISLKEKGYYPDVLIMSATPIPRTLSLTLYGDLDVSIIRELPGGRKIGEHVETMLCNQSSRDIAYEIIRSEVNNGRQAYIVCPLIEESDKLEVKAVMEEVDRLKNEIFPDLRVGFIHGRLKSHDKEAIMKQYNEGLLDILISTTVIEVGIDVPNATVMVIEDADRFGLAQLHQLRGRIGRGNYKSYCILFANPTTEEGKKRMDAICNIKDGFQLAEADLQIRGEGQLFGTRQSGLPDLKIAKLTRDAEVLLEARKEAFRIIDNDPHLQSPAYKSLLNEVKRKFADNLEWLFQA